MPDMLVRLYDLPDLGSRCSKLKSRGVEVRRARGSLIGRCAPSHGGTRLCLRYNRGSRADAVLF